MSALVSIITPLYNSEQFILETIASVQKQTYENWEMLIVDDCNKDQSAEIVQIE
ncbi:glycosyltransferase family 2 protein, partial [bacterium]|nr:glycosyltransferase family 2 protein [bacterium]